MKTVTYEMLETEIFNYISANSRNPKFVLLDANSYDNFTRISKPKEKIKLAESDQSEHKPSKFYSSYTAVVDILRVDTQSELFEVVG